ncbi:hypothetical protein AT1219_10950 [Vibrio alginolyticus]
MSNLGFYLVSILGSGIYLGQKAAVVMKGECDVKPSEAIPVS